MHRFRGVAAWTAAFSGAVVAGGLFSACAKPAPAPVETDLHYDSFGTKAGIDCANGRSLDIGGSNNTVTVTGICGAVTVTGADNKIHIEKVERDLVLTGLNNTVIYVTGDPKVDDRGNGNDVRRG